MDGVSHAQLSQTTSELDWFRSNQINVSPGYSVTEARKSLSTHFVYDGLKPRGRVSLHRFSDRLDDAALWFREAHPSADPLARYPRILKRAKLLRGQLSTISGDESPGVQARLAFECQVAFLVEGHDAFLDEAVLRWRHIQTSMNSSRVALERDIYKEWAGSSISLMEDVGGHPTEQDLADLGDQAHKGLDIPIRVHRSSVGRHRRSIKTLWNLLAHRVDHFDRVRLRSHGAPASLVLSLARDPNRWKDLTSEYRRRVTRDPALLRALEKSDEDDILLRALILRRFLEFLRSGKIVDTRSWRYCDLGTRFLTIEERHVESLVTREDIEQLTEGTFQFPPVPQADGLTPSDHEEEVGELAVSHGNATPLSRILDEVAPLVVRCNPTWFEDHKTVFLEQTDGMFSFTHSPEEFQGKLYRAIAFLGRNLRYSDSPEFPALQRFIGHYLSDEILDLEMQHLWNTLMRFSDQRTTLVLTDTMGIEGRRKSFFATVHGRYGTIGFADLRSVLLSLVPIYSNKLRSSDSEAMNIMEVLNHARMVLGNDLQWCTGDSHTRSHLAVGMAFASHGVINAGRMKAAPKRPGPRCMDRLKRNVELVNKVGMLLREEPGFGRMLASRKYIYVNGLNVRRLLEDLGSLISWNLHQQGIRIDQLSQLIETSNRQKRVIRIVERGVTRVHERNVSLCLKASELLLVSIAVWKIYDAGRHLRVLDRPISLEDVALFVPA